jgi:hypothetical protein
MGIGDKFNELKQKAQDVLAQHPDKVQQGIDKVEDFADKRTRGKYSDQITKGADMLKQRLGKQDPPR